MISRFGRATRRPAPPSERVYDDVPWSDPSEVAMPLWRRSLSAVELVVFVVILGVALTIATGIVLVVAFFLLDMLVG